MQIGDPKKTAFLAVVAVLALGFCFKQLFGGGASEPKVLRQAAGAADATGAQPAAAGAVAMFQLDQLRVDPFSHAKLAPKTIGNPNGGDTTPFNPAQGSTITPGTDFGTDGGTHLPGPLGPIDKNRPPDWPSPLNPDKQNPAVTLVKLTQVTLKAIVKVNQRLAYLSIDGLEARGFHAGEFIKNDIQVVFVNDDSVIVKSSKTTVTLKVGQKEDL